MSRSAIARLPLALLSLAALLGPLGCSSSRWCADCEQATPLRGLNYATPPWGQAGTAYPALNPAPTGGAVTTYVVASGSLPPGLALDPATGRISGTPTTPGVYTVDIQGSNTSSVSSQPLTFTIEPSVPLGLVYATPLVFASGQTIGGQAPVLTQPTPGLPTVYALAGASRAVTAAAKRGTAQDGAAPTGPLPPGLTLGADGTVSGTPTTPGVYAFTIVATNGTRTASSSASYTVTPAGALTLSYPVLQVFPAGSAVPALAATLGATTPGVPTTFAVTAGALPPGLGLQADGSISGTPSTPGVFPFTVTAVNGTLTASTGLTFTITPASSLTVAYAAPQTVTSGSPVAIPAPDVANGVPGLPLSYAVAAGSLPAGLVLNPDGSLTGTPAAPGVYTFTVTVSNGIQTASVTLTVTTLPAGSLTLNYAIAPVLTQGADAGVNPAALGNAIPGVAAAYAVTSGSLPQGLVLNPDGSITGVPTTLGVATFTVTVTDGPLSASVALTLTTVPAAAMTIAYASPATFTQGAPIPDQAAALANLTPGVPATFAVTAGALPQGLLLGADGTITGAPSAPGVYLFTVTATNGTRTASATAAYTVTSAAPLALAYSLDAGGVTVPSGTSIGTDAPLLSNATPGVPVTYAVTSGTLPAGLTLNGDGTLTGAPAAAGVFVFTVTATNGTLTASDTVTVVATPVAALAIAYPAPSPYPQGTPIAPLQPTLDNATPGLAVTCLATSGSLPPGLTLNLDGSITGTPTTAGVYAFTVTASNGLRTAGCAVTLAVEASSPLTLDYGTTSLSLVAGTTPSTLTPQVGSATPGLTTAFTMTGTLPQGLALNPDGTLTGTPTLAGSGSFTVTAHNGSRTASATLAWTVADAAPTGLAYTSPATYTAGYVIAANHANATGGTPTLYQVTSGQLPQGLALNAATGDITGKPTAAVASASVTIRASNGQGGVSQTLVLTVLAQPTASLSANPSTVPVGQSSSLTVLLSNGTGVLSGGTLTGTVPVVDGASLSTGTVNAPGSYVYTLTVTNAQNAAVSSSVQVDWVTPTANYYSTPVDPAGGTYAPPPGNPLNGQISVAVPAQTASCGASTLTMTTEASYPGTIPSPAQACSPTFNIATDVGYPFKTPMTVTLAYDPTLTSPGLAASDVPMAFFWDPTYSAWVTTGVKALDTTNHLVTFTTLLPGRYVVMAVPGLASSLAGSTPGFTVGTDDWLQNNLDIYDLPNGASLGMGSYASWYFNFAKGVGGQPGLSQLFASASDPNALALISRLANGTLDEWAQVWQQSSYALTGTQTGLGLVTGLMVTGQPQLFLMGDARPAVNNALATLVTSFDAATGKFGVSDPNYPGNALTITWTPGTGAFSSYDRAMAYSPALVAFALEGQTSIHRLADYETVLDGASAGYPATSFASIAITDIAGISNPDLSSTLAVPSASGVTISGTVTNGDQSETSLLWSQNLDAPRTAVTLTPVDATHSSFSFTIPALSNPYGTTVMLETTANPCDPTFSHSGFLEFTLAQNGLSAWFPNACFEDSASSPAPWVNQEGSNSSKNYPNPTDYSLNTFSSTGQLNGYGVTYTTASTYSGVVHDPAHADDANMLKNGVGSPIPDVLDGANSFRVDSQLTGSHISKVSQTLTVPSSVSYPRLSFYWAFVAQSAGHAPAQEPFCDIVVYDLTAQTVLYYVHHFPPTSSGGVNYSDGYPGWVTGSGSGATQWFGINWQKVTLNLGTTRGNHQLLVSVTAAGCSQGGHAGYAYLDSIGCN